MEKLQIKTRKGKREPKYLTNIDSVTTFLRHSEDKIIVINGETVNIEIYENGSLIFFGDKGDLFDLLTLNNEAK
jgi:hypothetical protein